jgi:DNA polymerase-3 subunit gamma/tau
MAPETVFEHLTQVLAAEQLSAEPLALRLLARAARGSMRDALSLADQAIAFGNGQLQEAGVRQMLGSVDRSHVLHMIRALIEGDGAAVVNQVNDLRLQGVSAAATLEDMAMLLQRMAVMQMVPSMAQDGDDPDTQGLADLAQTMPAEETQLLYSLCLHGRAELGLAPDEYAALTMVLLRLLAFKPQAVGAAEKKSPLTRLKATPQATPEPIQAAAPAASDAGDAEPKSAPAAAPAAALLKVPLSQVTPPLAAPMARPLESAPPDEPVISHAKAEQSLVEPPPWEDWPDTTDNAQVPAIQTAAPVQHAPVQAAPVQQLPHAAPGLRSLPVREVMPSLRADVPTLSAATPVQATPEGDVWFEAVQGLMAQDAVTALVRELALQSQLLGRDAGHWQLRVERETLNHAASRERLQTALQAAGHGDVQLGIEIGPVTDSPARRLAVQAAEKMQAAQELIQNDPLVQAMVRDFGAKIVPGSIQLI